MNYNTVFAPTAAAEHSIKGHAANTGTYLLIAAIVALTAIQTALNWISEQYDSREIYRLQVQIAQVKSKRFFVRKAIKAEEFRLAHSPRIVAAMDKVFCLTD